MGKPRDKRKSEHYYVSAKKQGYRARSAFKLKQMSKKFGLFKGVYIVVELCSSPGGWTQVLREINPNMEIVAVDLNPMPYIDGVKFLQADATAPETLAQIEKLTRGSADLVISDCSPNMSGAWEMDVAIQLELARTTLDIGHKLLSNSGRVLAKVFQGPGFQEFMSETKARFQSVKLIKPDASRKSSAEIYLLATGPKGRKPKKQTKESST